MFGKKLITKFSTRLEQIGQDWMSCVDKSHPENQVIGRVFLILATAVAELLNDE